MEFYGWSQKDLAEILDISEKHLSQMLSNTAPVTMNMARLLSSTFQQSPEFWINLDAQTWLRKVEIEAEKQKNIPEYSKTRLQKLANEIPRYSRLDNGIRDFIRELKKTGIIFLIISNLEKTYTDGAAYWVNKNPIVALTSSLQWLFAF